VSFYIACSNQGCTENGVPKQTDDAFRDYFDQGMITCGACYQPITTEVAAPPEVTPH